MDPWWLYLLVFIFGYVTCQTFYFIKSTRISLKLIKSSNVIYLLMMTKVLENIKFVETLSIARMHASNCEQQKIDKLVADINDERENFKNNGIKWIYQNTPSAFRDIIGFQDWASAMKFLMLNKKEAIDFWRFKND